MAAAVLTSDENNPRERPSDPWLDEHRDLLRSDLTALDLGCGSGEDSHDLLEMGLNVVSLDQSMQQLRRARKQAPAARFVKADITKGTPFDDKTFDVVVASLSIHYFDWATSYDVAAEIARILKPSGWFICRVNRVGDIHFEYRSGLEIEPEYFEVRPGFRKRFFNETMLRRLLEPHFDIDMIAPRTSSRWGLEKLTLVGRARKRS
jgi:SAM-dependent methyltransferase